MQQTDNDSWLDVLPALPLARGVPCTFIGRSAERSIVSEANPDKLGTAFLYGYTFAYGPDNGLRVDLGDLQGFGYALRQLAQLTRDNRPAHVEALLAQLTSSWLNWPSTNDNDRRRLASALDEVVRGR